MCGCDPLDLAWIVRTADSSPGRRVTNHPQPIPNDESLVNLALQNAIGTPLVAVDRRRAPSVAATRRQNTVKVEMPSDLARRVPGEVALENVPHDCGFCLDDLELACAACDGPVAVYFAARVSTFVGQPRKHAIRVVYWLV